MQLTKKDLITKLIDAARKAGNANPFALGFIAFDDLRMKLEGPMTTTGQECHTPERSSGYERYPDCSG